MVEGLTLYFSPPRKAEKKDEIIRGKCGRGYNSIVKRRQNGKEKTRKEVSSVMER